MQERFKTANPRFVTGEAETFLKHRVKSVLVMENSEQEKQIIGSQQTVWQGLGLPPNSSYLDFKVPNSPRVLRLLLHGKCILLCFLRVHLHNTFASLDCSLMKLGFANRCYASLLAHKPYKTNPEKVFITTRAVFQVGLYGSTSGFTVIC